MKWLDDEPWPTEDNVVSVLPFSRKEVLDILSESILPARTIARYLSCSTFIIQEAISRLVIDGWVTPVNTQGLTDTIYRRTTREDRKWLKILYTRPSGEQY